MLKIHLRSTLKILYMLLLTAVLAACATQPICDPGNDLSGMNAARSSAEKQGHRTIVVASAQHKIIKEFRRQDRERHPTNLSWFEQLWLGYANTCLNNRVLETTYDPNYASRNVIERVRRLGGSTYVFLTKFGPIPAIDHDPTIDPARIFEILDRGVDGIMTDRPAAMRGIIDEWLESRSPAH